MPCSFFLWFKSNVVSSTSISSMKPHQKLAAVSISKTSAAKCTWIIVAHIFHKRIPRSSWFPVILINDPV
jgi:hypothetical protein